MRAGGNYPQRRSKDAIPVPHYIDGQEVFSRNQLKQDIFNPAIGQIIGAVNFASEKEINQAVDSTANAFAQWSATTPLNRARILFKFKELLEQNINELAQIITREHGKIFEDARGSVLRAIELVEYYCGIPGLLKGNIQKMSVHRLIVIGPVSL